MLYSAVLALTLLAVTWAGGQDRPKPAPTTAPAERVESRGDVSSAESQAPPHIALDKLAPRAPIAVTNDPLQATSWEQMTQDEARKSVPPAPPPPPQAPPLPFTYLGKLVEEGETIVFLTKQDRNYILHRGDTLDGVYGVETIEEERLVLNYLPLGIRQTLSFSAVGALPTSPAPTATPTEADEPEKQPE